MFKEILVNLLSSPVIWAVIFSIVFMVIGYIITKTKTKKDDKYYAIVKGFICNAFNIAEKYIPDNSAGNLGKIDVALKSFNEEYQRRFGTAPDADLLDKAKAEWSIIATEIKKSQSS